MTTEQINYSIKSYGNGEALTYNDDYVFKITHRGDTLHSKWVGYSMEVKNLVYEKIMVVWFFEQPNVVHSFRYDILQGYEYHICQLIFKFRKASKHDSRTN